MTHRRTIPSLRRAGWLALLVVGVLLIGPSSGLASPSASAPAPPSPPPPLAAALAGAHSAATNSPALGKSPTLTTSNSSNQTLQCDGMYWASTIWATYDPSFCYGHDEPTVSYISTAVGSGEDAHFQVSLPADGTTYAQGDFYATLWFGGTVYDTQSTGGGNQAFLEFQFYPAPPASTGPNSGAADCLPDGAFAPVWTPGSNEWFACAVVWQLQGSVENAAFAGPLDAAGTTGILVMHSNDTLDVNYSGVAQSATQGWTISVADQTSGGAGSVTLVNGTLVLPPYYSTAAPGNTLLWGASNPGAIAFAYEIGHSLNPAIPTTCAPGDNVCDSYWPGRWAAAGQIDLGLPVLGASSALTYPSQVVFSSSQGGEYEVNASVCGAPSSSTSTNCMYPFFQYRGGSYGFTFGTSPEPNATYVYGGEYQFPATQNSRGQWNGRTAAAPWGTLSTAISPLNATVEFNRMGATDQLTVNPNGRVTGQFVEGPYWLNISAPGCVSTSTFVYVRTGATVSPPGALSCGGAPPLSASASAVPTSGAAPLSVVFTGSASGGTTPYAYAWTFGDGTTSTAQDPTHTYTVAGQYTATLTVTDAHGVTAGAVVSIAVSGPLSAHASASPTSGGVPLAVQFAGSGGGGVPPYSYFWTFGDGNSSTLQDPSHTYSAVGNYSVGLTVTDHQGSTASASLLIRAAPAPTYSVDFHETGLPSGTSWNVSLGGIVRSSGTASIAFALENGSYAYSIGVSDSRYRPITAHGTVTVSGGPKTVAVGFEPMNYTITFTESTLPSGRTWSVVFGSQNRSTSGPSIAFTAVNGSYAFTVSGPAGYGVLPSAGSLAVRGGNETLTEVFSAQLYQVDFRASGLPSGTNWTVTLGTTSRSSTTAFVNFSSLIGTYPYVLTAVAGFLASPTNGSLTVSASNQTVPVAFTPILYPVTFAETGLPNATAWELTVDGISHPIPGTSISLPLAAGTHTYSVGPPSGYQTPNASGTVVVIDRAVAVQIPFSAVTPSPSFLSGLFTSPDFLLGLLAVGLMVAGTVIYVIGARRRRRESPPAR